MSSVNDTVINIERFLDEVRIRSCIWDPSSESYKDRELKKRLWDELCTLFYPQFESSTAKEKAEICKALQGKWKNTKDCYRRYLKSLKTKSGQARKNVKSYVYAAQMSFMDSSIALAPTEASPIDPQTPSVEDDSEESEEVERTINSDEDQSFSSRSTVYRRRKRRLESKIENYLDGFEKVQRNSAADTCDDLNFFKSLIPIVKPLPIHKKLKLRMEFMKIAYEYSQDSSTEVTTPPVSITPLQSNDASTLASTQRTAVAHHLPSGINWFENPTKPTKQSEVDFNQQPRLNHTVTSNTVGETEGKNYHDLQPKRGDKTIEVYKEDPSAYGVNLSARHHQEKVESSVYFPLGRLSNTEMSDNVCCSEDGFA